MVTMTSTIIKRIINRYGLFFLVFVILLTSLVRPNLLFGSFRETIITTTSAIKKIAVVPTTTITNESKAEEQPQLVVSPACLPFRYQNSIRNGTHQKNDFYDEFWSEKKWKRPTRIHLLHMRKAGGTSLSMYFKKVVKSNATSFRRFDSCEGHRNCIELDYDNDGVGDGYQSYYNKKERMHTSGRKGINTRYDALGGTLYVTSLREPISRALSSYKYEMRFECTPGNFEDPNTTEKFTLDYFVTQKNMYPANSRVEHSFLPAGSPGRLWVCNSNCYARWVTGMYIPKNIYQWSLSHYNTHYPVISDYYYTTTNTNSTTNGDNDKDGKDGSTNNTNTNDNNSRNSRKPNQQEQLSQYGRALSAEALRLLLRFDVIIVLEWLESDPEYARFIEDVFFGSVRGIGTHRDAYCAKEMRYKNNLLPLTIPNATLQQLHRANTIDTQLYQTLTSCV